MNLDSKEQQKVREYLLGLASQEDSSRVEEQFLSDEAFYEELLIAEEELIDQYLSEKLSQPERDKFETHFLAAPERQQKLRFARALHKYLDFATTPAPQEDIPAEPLSEEEHVAKPTPKKGFFSFLPGSSPILSYSLAAAVLLVVLSVSWLAYKTLIRPAPRDGGNVLAITLTPNLVRDGGELKRVAIQEQTDSLDFQLVLPTGDYQSYNVELQTSENKSIYTQESVPAEFVDGSKKVRVTVPAKLLTVGDYKLKLTGVSKVDQIEYVVTYYFRVVSR